MADYDWADLMYGGGGSEYPNPYQDPYAAYGGQGQYYDNQGLIDMLNAAGGQDYFGGGIGAPPPEIGGTQTFPRVTDAWESLGPPGGRGYFGEATTPSTSLWGQANEFLGSPTGKMLMTALGGVLQPLFLGSDAERNAAMSEVTRIVQNQGYNPKLVAAFLENVQQAQQLTGQLPQPGLTPEAQQLMGQEAAQIGRTGITSEQEATRGVLSRALAGTEGWREMYGKGEAALRGVAEQAPFQEAQKQLQWFGGTAGNPAAPWSSRARGLELAEMLEAVGAKDLAAQEALARYQQGAMTVPLQAAREVGGLAGPYGQTHAWQQPLAALQAPSDVARANIKASLEALYQPGLTTGLGLSQQSLGGTQTTTGTKGTTDIWGPAIAGGISQLLGTTSQRTTGGTV